MNILTEACSYQTKDEFEMLTKAIQREIDCGNLSEYYDKTWIRKRRNGWNGEYISTVERKLYTFNGSHVSDQDHTGTWQIIRDEKEINGVTIFESKYKIRAQEPGIFIDLDFEIHYSKGEKTIIKIDWSSALLYEGSHSSLIKSTTEYGIISAFEDINPNTGTYFIKIRKLRYHPIDSSFSLLAYAANRNLKRALFVEHVDEMPKIENGMIMRKFTPVYTIGKFNNA